MTNNGIAARGALAMIKALIGNMTEDYTFLVFTYNGKVVLTDAGWPYHLFISHNRYGYEYGINGKKHLTSQNTTDEEIENKIQNCLNLGLTLAFVEEWNKDTIYMSDICS